jgi:integrase/recombinase XerC/integrase/recombinase XerD
VTTKLTTPAPLEVPKLALKYLQYMENVETCSDLTLRAYRLDLSQAFPGIWNQEKNSKTLTLNSEEELLKLSKSALTRWSTLGPASRNRKSSTLKSFFSYLFKEGLIQRDLASQIHSPKVPRKIPHFISVDEAVACLQSFKEDEHEEKLLFLLLYGVGLRVSEACDLKWSNVDLDQRILRIKGKGSKERLVAIPDSVAKTLKANIKKSAISIWYKPLSTRTAYDWVSQRGIKAGLMRPIHPHALRHSFATHLLASGANLRTLQELLGHASLTATEKYTHLGMDQLARTLEKHHPLKKHVSK